MRHTKCSLLSIVELCDVTEAAVTIGLSKNFLATFVDFNRALKLHMLLGGRLAKKFLNSSFQSQSCLTMSLGKKGCFMGIDILKTINQRQLNIKNPMTGGDEAEYLRAGQSQRIQCLKRL